MDTLGEERRPLLNPEDTVSAIEQQTDNNGLEQTVTPLPVKQISIVLLMQLAEPIAFTVIYPFIAELVYSTGITGGDESKIGYYAGLIESIFFLTEGLFVLQYGRISDRIGRRPVLLFGMSGLTVSIFTFGLSKTFWGLVITRALSGALNGNVGVLKSMMAELTDETNQAQCKPDFLTGYPLFIRTEPRPNSSDSQAEDDVGDIDRPASRRAPSIKSVLTKRACIVILNYAFLAYVGIAYLCVVPVIFAAPIEGGGLNFTPQVIGVILGIQGIVNGLVPVFYFAPIHRRFGTKRTYIAGLASYLFLIASLPAMNALARRGMTGALWTLMGVHLVVSCPPLMSFSCTIIFVTSAASSKSSLGTLHGVSQATISTVRAIGPASATSLFAFSIERNVWGGWFVYAVLIGVNLLGIWASFWLEDESTTRD
ncbi:hypothetical protein FRC12_007239 [Ceratobasidium sp. 428]|nr:hypothetical protein FRC12_007239 [Ceratobasidium sp. 428]